MTINEQITNKLISSSDFRERRFRDSYLLNMVLEKNAINAMFIPSTQLKDIIKDYMSFERIWRDILDKKRPDLRGEDWEDGKALAQEKAIELGYEVGFHEMTKI